MSGLEWPPELNEAVPMAEEAERIRQDLVRRRDQARGLLELAAVPLLAADWKPMGYAADIIEAEGSTLAVRAVVILKDAAGQVISLRVGT